MWPRGFFFDTAGEPTGGDPAPAEPSGAPDPGEPAAAAPAPAEPVATPAGWAGPSEEEWLETQTLLRGLAERQAPAAAAQPADAQPAVELDPWSDNFGQQLVGTFSGLLDKALEQRLGPITARQEYEERQEAENRARDILNDYGSAQGVEFDIELARQIAEPHLESAFERYGYTSRAAEMGLRQGADALIEHDKKVAERAVNEYKASLERVAGAPGEPPNGSTGAGVTVTGEAETEYDAVQRALARAVAT